MALPSKPITDPTFEYRNSARTDIRETFARIREEAAQRERFNKQLAAMTPWRLALTGGDV